jgi:penicillin G amidase
MRIILSALCAIIVAAFIYILNTKAVLQAPLGSFLSPQQGFWQNAEPANKNFSEDLKMPGLKGKATVYFDDKLIPHVFAEQENDAFFVQGFLHAKFRLWQMELQTISAAGRASEIIGEKALDHDREFRRLGMVFAAENSLKEMEKDAEIKAVCDAYTAGVNAYINSLTESTLPLEYKLIGYRPEQWSNFKTALFLKYMSYSLAGHDSDFESTNARSFFTTADFNLLYPPMQDSLDPIVPKGTKYLHAAVNPVAPASADSLYFYNNIDSVKVQEKQKPNPLNGSNNWAVAGSKTKSGSPILCNDPHLGLNLPSIWFEMQISTPSFNAYGATFPGSPAIIIGYNDSCAFGFTNGGRDVRDYYEIKFKDESRKQYWFNNAWKKTDFRVEEIKIAGKPVFYDSVAYTAFGPVMYDKYFGGKRSAETKNYAVTWTAHKPSNDLRAFYMLDHAKNYADYQNAVANLKTPGQNCVFACKSGDIAIRTQGDWPAKWKGQGDFVMPGTDSSYMWQGMIPQNEIPFQYNPERGFVSSANQKPADSTYPYYLGREYPVARGLLINKKLSGMQQITPQEMMTMQADNYNIYAEEIRPVFLKNINVSVLNNAELKYLDLLRNWNLRNDADSKGATVYDQLYKAFKSLVYDDEYAKAPAPIARPFESTLIEATLRDSNYKFFDNINTPQKETLKDDATTAFKNAAAALTKIEAETKLEWAKFKDTHIDHLTKIEAFSRMHLPVGGGTNMINAITADHGPSWRMVISLTPETEAYGVYPGGQSGNPGSFFYDNFIDQWVAAKYYSLWMMKKDETKDPRIKWTMNFSN